jgi:hypothetical protein
LSQIDAANADRREEGEDEKRSAQGLEIVTNDKGDSHLTIHNRSGERAPSTRYVHFPSDERDADPEQNQQES